MLHSVKCKSQNPSKRKNDVFLCILDAHYEKANLTKMVHDCCQHLTTSERNALLKLLLTYEDLFDGTLGDFKIPPVKLEVKPGAEPCHAWPFPVPMIHEETLKTELKRLCEIGVLRKCSNSPWGSLTFVIPKKNGTVRFVTDFRKVNNRLIRKPFPIPKISDVLYKLEGFQFATALDLNMGYYTIRLDPDAQKICTIVTPWGKYQYLHLPMGIEGSLDIFQEKMSELMESLEYVRTYLDDLLDITNDSFNDHIRKLEIVLKRLRSANLKLMLKSQTFVLQVLRT